jgi:hypothetical protein
VTLLVVGLHRSLGGNASPDVPERVAVQHLPHRSIPLLGHPQLDKYLGSFRSQVATTEEHTNQASQQPPARQSVKHLAERLSRRNRNCVLTLSSSYRNPMVKHEPEPHRLVGKQIGKQ